MGMPRSAARTSAVMYLPGTDQCDRVRRRRSPAGAVAACWLASGSAPLLGVFESAIRCRLYSDWSDKATNMPVPMSPAKRAGRDGRPTELAGASSSPSEASSRSREWRCRQVSAQIPVTAWIRPSAMALTKVS